VISFFPNSGKQPPSFLAPLLEILETTLPESTVFHNKTTLDLEQAFRIVPRSWPDFVIHSPHFGLIPGFVLPGTFINQGNGDWHLLGPWGDAPISDPFPEFESILKRFSQILTEKGFPPHCVSFVPCLATPAGELDWMQIPKGWIPLGRQDSNFGGILKDLFQNPGSILSQNPVFDPLFRACLEEIYFPHVATQKGSAIGTLMAQLTREQLKAYEACILKTRVQVTGPAGCGKTLLALNRARQELELGHRTLLTCYNRALSTTLHKSLCPYPGGQLSVLNFHDLCRLVCKLAGDDLLVPEDPGDQPRFYNIEAPERVIEAAKRIGGFGFDSIVVDEAQDFPELWWEALGSISHPTQKEVRLAVFYDYRQNLYLKQEPKNILPNDLGELVTIDRICRNTRNIQELAQKYLGKNLGINLKQAPEGPDPRFISANNPDEQYRLIKTQIREWLDIGIQPSQIAVLFPSSKSESYEALIKEFPFPLSQDLGTWQSGFGPLIMTWRRFRGLEAEAVILADLGEIKSIGVQKPSDLYCAITRARTYLTLLHCPDYPVL